MENSKLSDRLRTVLQDLKQITDALEITEKDSGDPANDDFLTRVTIPKKDG